MFICTATTAIFRGGYGQGIDPIWLDNVACTGRESRLIDCRANLIGTHNCDHSEDAGIICAPLFIPGPGALLHYALTITITMVQFLHHSFSYALAPDSCSLILNAIRIYIDTGCVC